MPDLNKIENTAEDLKTAGKTIGGKLGAYILILVSIVSVIAYLVQTYQSCNNTNNYNSEKNYLTANYQKVDSIKTVVVLELQKSNDKVSGLKRDSTRMAKVIRDQNEKIRVYAKLLQTTQAQNLNIPFKLKLDSVFKPDKSFDTSNTYFDISGQVDSNTIKFKNISFYDELELIITEKTDFNMKGYVTNKSPYSFINKLQIDFQLPTQEKGWNWLSYAAGAGTVIGLIVCGLLIK